MTIREERRASAAIGRSWRLAAVSVIVAGLGHVLAAQPPAPTQNPSGQQQAPPTFEETVEVVGATPIPGLGIDRNKIPSNIQTATADALERTGADFIGEQMLLAVPGVQVNEATTNPFQPDLQFRGFVGSPLLVFPKASLCTRTASG